MAISDVDVNVKCQVPFEVISRMWLELLAFPPGRTVSSGEYLQFMKNEASQVIYRTEPAYSIQTRFRWF